MTCPNLLHLRRQRVRHLVRLQPDRHDLRDRAARGEAPDRATTQPEGGSMSTELDDASAPHLPRHRRRADPGGGRHAERQRSRRRRRVLDRILALRPDLRRGCFAACARPLASARRSGEAAQSRRPGRRCRRIGLAAAAAYYMSRASARTDRLSRAGKPPRRPGCDARVRRERHAAAGDRSRSDLPADADKARAPPSDDLRRGERIKERTQTSQWEPHRAAAAARRGGRCAHHRRRSVRIGRGRHLSADGLSVVTLEQGHWPTPRSLSRSAT